MIPQIHIFDKRLDFVEKKRERFKCVYVGRHPPLGSDLCRLCLLQQRDRLFYGRQIFQMRCQSTSDRFSGFFVIKASKASWILLNM